MKTVLKFIKPYFIPVSICLLIKALSSVSELAIPRILAIIIDEDVPRGELSAVIKNGLIMLALAVLGLLLNIIGNKLSGYTTGRISRDMRAKLFEKTARLEAEDTDGIGLASLTSRLTSDTYNLTQFMARIQRIGIKAPLMLIGGIVITLTIDVRLSLILIALLFPVSLTVYKISKKAIPIYNEEQKLIDGVVRRVDETSRGIRVIKALSKTEYEKKRFAEGVDAVSEKELCAGRIMSATKPINDFLFYMGLCAVILVGYFISREEGEAAVGKLLAFMTYFTVILNNMIMISRVFVQGSRAVASGKRIEEVLLKEEKLPTFELEAKASAPFILFDEVSFSYNKKLPDLSGISFALEKGETLGIIGATGSGKSTLISLLMRLYDVDSGAIYIGGEDIRSIPKEALRKRFGAVFQNDFIFSGSIRENVDFFRGIGDDAILRALEIAQAEYVLELKDGLDHQLTTGGTNLSGGQRQRLLIARAIAADPEILLLDDCSSALDYRTDSSLRRAIKENISTTTVIVSQRIASVMNADKIILLDSGRIIGVGTHSELLSSCPEYREISRVQTG